MRVALRIDVLTTDAARRGVPAILDLLEQYGVTASFFVSLGPSRLADVDLTGRLGWFARARSGLRRSLGRRPDLGSTCADEFRAIRAAGHDLGLSAFDALAWRENAAEASPDWMDQAVRRASDAFSELFGQPPTAFSAPGWQVNPRLFELEQTLGLSYACDTRGRYPYGPMLQGVRSTCPQIPVTLPTLAEVLRGGMAPLEKAHEYLYAESRHLLPAGHVYAARADVEGIGQLALLERLLVMWKGQDGALRSLADVRNELDLDRLPVHQVGWGQVAGNDDYLAQQSVQVPA